MASRKCVNDTDIFCYICGNYTVVKQRQDITDFVKNAYYAYFGVRLGDQDKTWAPHKVCRTCVEGLRLWLKGKKKCMPFAIPMVWREPRNHHDDCYFCLANVHGYSSKNKKEIIYPNLPSAIRPILHNESLPVPSPPTNLESINEPNNSEDDENQEQDVYKPEVNDKAPILFNQHELNDLVRDLNLPKIKAELLGSRLKSKNLLLPETQFSWYRHREKELVPYFSEKGNLVYCNNIKEIMNFYGILYNASEWRFFIDSSKTSLKGVLLHNGNQYASIPIAYSVHLKETYENLELLLDQVKYKDHEWLLCGDLKVIGMLLGQQSGYTKFPCFLCEWDSRDKKNHWEKKDWPSRISLSPGTKNVIKDPLVNPKNVLLPPLHIKLGIMKQFVKALNKENECFKYICSKFPSITDAKLKEGIFVGPQIRKLLTDSEFEKTMNDCEKEAWLSFKCVVENFLGNKKDPNYKIIVADMLEKLRLLGCNMSIKIHFLHAHIEFFPENLGAVSEEHGERFHQDIKDMEKRYQGKWNKNMMADYCWMLKRDLCASGRKATKRNFSQTN